MNAKWDRYFHVVRGRVCVSVCKLLISLFISSFGKTGVKNSREVIKFSSLRLKHFSDKLWGEVVFYRSNGNCNPVITRNSKKKTCSAVWRKHAQLKWVFIKWKHNKNMEKSCCSNWIASSECTTHTHTHKYFIISFHVTTLKKWHFAIM